MTDYRQKYYELSRLVTQQQAAYKVYAESKKQTDLVKFKAFWDKIDAMQNGPKQTQGVMQWEGR